MTIGAIAFGSPLALAGLFALPVIWWLLRLTPPVPRRTKFPAIRFLVGLQATEQQPARTPLWLLLLRLTLAALLIIGLADPTLRPQLREETARPTLLVVDDGWASAHDWAARKSFLMDRIEEAARANVAVAVLTTAPHAAQTPLSLRAPAEARGLFDTLQPSPWATDRAHAAERLQEADLPGDMQVIWLTDGIEAPGTAALQAGLKAAGRLTTIGPALVTEPLLLLPPRADGNGLILTVARAPAGPERAGSIRAKAPDGRVIGEARFVFPTNAAQTETRLTLPRVLLNDITRLEIVEQRSAAATQLLDDRNRRRSVALVSGDPQTDNQPLLSDLHYLERALSPFADVTRGQLDTLITPSQSVIVLADVGRIVGTAEQALIGWVEDGGVLVRFAGPKLAENADGLIPVPLRHGGRTLGGAMSWSEPQGLSPFAPDSPFAGLPTSPEIKVARQVLAEPVTELGTRTWARLEDGTPLVTGAARGRGLVVLFHVTANTAWSDLPLSSLFVDMLARIVTLANGNSPLTEDQIGSGVGAPRPPIEVLDGFGALDTPPPWVLPLAADTALRGKPGPRTPPGLYGSKAAPTAYNIGQHGDRIAALSLDADIAPLDATSANRARSLKPWFLGAALAFAILDGLVLMVMSASLMHVRSLLSGLSRLSPILLFAIVLVLPIRPVAADEGLDAEQFARLAALQLRLGYVRTGNQAVDAISHAGIAGLSQTLTQRTAVEPAEPLGVDLERDEIAFFPLLYWQVPADQTALSDQALTKLDRFMKTGGTLVIDTADADQVFAGDAGGGPAAVRLRQILAKLDLPPLELVPEDHVLTKSFYLVRTFPGRWAHGPLWVEKAGGGADHDGVATLIVGANDWASAWARDDSGRPLAPVVPGGEAQREMAMRFGVNLVMYALTGNYKADQVHVPALLERLGQ